MLALDSLQIKHSQKPSCGQKSTNALFRLPVGKLKITVKNIARIPVIMCFTRLKSRWQQGNIPFTLLIEFSSMQRSLFACWLFPGDSPQLWPPACLHFLHHFQASTKELKSLTLNFFRLLLCGLFYLQQEKSLFTRARVIRLHLPRKSRITSPWGQKTLITF